MSQQNYDQQLNEMMEFSKEGIFSKVILKTQNVNITLMCLAKSADIDTHTSTKNGCVHVLKGKGEFTLYDQKIMLEPGVFIKMPENAPHSLKAYEDLAILLTLYIS